MEDYEVDIKLCNVETALRLGLIDMEIAVKILKELLIEKHPILTKYKEGEKKCLQT
jgi:hypothetical protein